MTKNEVQSKKVELLKEQESLENELRDYENDMQRGRTREDDIKDDIVCELESFLPSLISKYGFTLESCDKLQIEYLQSMMKERKDCNELFLTAIKESRELRKRLISNKENLRKVEEEINEMEGE